LKKDKQEKKIRLELQSGENIHSPANSSHS